MSLFFIFLDVKIFVSIVFMTRTTVSINAVSMLLVAGFLSYLSICCRKACHAVMVAGRLIYTSEVSEVWV